MLFYIEKEGIRFWLYLQQSVFLLFLKTAMRF